MSIQRIVQDGRLLITVSGGAPPSRYIPYPPFPGTATEKTKKPAQTHCLSGTNTDKQYPWYHPHSGRPALSFADRHCPTCTQRVIPPAAHTRRFGNGNAPRRLLLTEDFLRVHPCFLRRASTIPQLSVGFCRGLLLFIFGLNGMILSHLPRPVKGDFQKS